MTTSSPRDLADLRESIALVLCGYREVPIAEQTGDLAWQVWCEALEDADAVLAVVGPHVEALEAALEPGKAPAIVAAMFAEAEQRGMSPFSAKHALSWLLERLDAAEAQVKCPRCGHGVSSHWPDHQADPVTTACVECLALQMHTPVELSTSPFDSPSYGICCYPATDIRRAAALAPQPAATEEGRS